MEIFLIKALQLMMSLSLLVIVHEGGHFLFARLFKVRVETFCVFFHPWFKLFKYKPKNSDTEYVLGWLPLGGYCKISGMIDESMDTEQMSQPAKPWEFRSKPAWQRLLIMVGGVCFNFILALIIYAGMLFTWGETYIETSEIPNGMEFNEAAHEVGFQDGDILLSADGVPFGKYGSNVVSSVVDARQVTVLRNGQESSVYIPEDFMQKLMADGTSFASIRYSTKLGTVNPDYPASKAGLAVGDSLVAINGVEVASWFDILDALSQLKEQQVYDFNVEAYRGAEKVDFSLKADSTFLLGIGVQNIPFQKQEYSLLASIPAGAKLGVNTLANYANSMKHVFSKEGVKQLGGFGAIGSFFPAEWNWLAFWNMTALLSIILAFMNILPIPALDGGHVLFLLYEIVTGRKPSDKFLERAQVVGMLILFTLLIWANLNDVLRFFF